MGFGGYLIINLLALDCMHHFLFSVEILFLFGCKSVFNYLLALSSDRLRELVRADDRHHHPLLDSPFLSSLLNGTLIPRLFGSKSVFYYQLAFSWLSEWIPLLCGTRIPRLFGFLMLFYYQLAFSHPTAGHPLLRGPRIPRLCGFLRFFNYQRVFSRPSAWLPL